MTAFTTLVNALFLPGKKILGATGMALRDNILAAMEGDATAVAAGVTLKDAALDTGAATAEGVTWVGLRTAGLAAGAVGSYALLSDQTTSGPLQTRTFGQTLAGSSLNTAHAGGANAVSVSGTWRCMGRSQYGDAGSLSLSSSNRVTVWLRIS